MSARRRAAVLGSPVAHSLSPELHRAAYAALGLAWSYDAIDVDGQRLPAFLDGLDESWAGLSLTMPLKRAVIPLLDEVSGVARDVEAVNTVTFPPAPGVARGRAGHNTDVPGMVAALRERGVRQVASAAVLGGGATAASAFAALRAVCRGEVTVYVRDERRKQEMRALAARLGREVRVASFDAAGQALHADLVVATTPAGSTDALCPLVPSQGAAGARGVLFDVVYDPWPTPLADAWRAAGGPVVGGLDLLIHQAVLQVELMTGRRAPLGVLREAGERALARRV